MEEYDAHHAYPVLTAGEAILWRGKPKRGAFIAAKSLTLFPVAVVWLIFDLNFIGKVFSSGEMLGFLIPFFTLHLMPVWVWLANVITANRRWKNTNYYVTNRRIIIQGGFFAVNETSLFYKELRNAHLRVGLMNKLFQTGDIAFDDGFTVHNNKQNKGHAFEALEDADSVYRRVQKVILDMQTDMEYPNAFRPEDNPGYQTQYRP
jgi:hypothetical protein